VESLGRNIEELRIIFLISYKLSKEKKLPQTLRKEESKRSEKKLRRKS